MKDLEKIKTNMILTMIYRSVFYFAWFLFAFAFTFFIRDEITDFSIFGLILALIIIFASANFIKYCYKELAHDNYYNIKHEIEMKFFKSALSLDFNKINNMNLDELGNEILKVSYHYTKFIYDVGEYLIPGIIGILIMFMTLVNISWIVAILILLAIIALTYYRYQKLDDKDIIGDNKNNLLKDFVNKLFTIKVLNMKDFAIKRLDENKDVSIELENKEGSSDIIFNNGLLAIISLILITVSIFVNVTITKLGLIIFFLLISINMQKLLFNFAGSIKNGIILIKEKDRLENKLVANDVGIRNEFKKIGISGGVVKYESGISIKIPNFELNLGDTISIMGKSGQGKSTIVNVLSGIYKLDEGSMFIDSSLTNDIVDAVYISNSTKLFNISLKENITLNKEVTDEEIINYLKEANLIKWYNELPNGLDTIIDNITDPTIILKLSLIRGIIMNKEIYFLDIKTKEEMLETEKIIVSMIKKHLKKKTIIIVSDSTILTNLCKKHYFIKDHTLLESEPLL